MRHFQSSTNTTYIVRIRYYASNDIKYSSYISIAFSVIIDEGVHVYSTGIRVKIGIVVRASASLCVVLNVYAYAQYYSYIRYTDIW